MEHHKADVWQMAGRGTAGDDTARFLRELRQLRDGAGLGHAELAARAHYPYDTIKAAEVGPTLPDLPVLSAYVRGCGGTAEEWEERWRRLTRTPSLPVSASRHAGNSAAASAGARIGAATQVVDAPDPSVIIAALSRVAEGMAGAGPETEAAPLTIPPRPAFPGDDTLAGASPADVSMGDVPLPDVSLDHISLADVSMDHASLADVSLDRISLADVSLPEVSLDDASLAKAFPADPAAYPVTDPAAGFVTDPAAYPMTDPAAGFATDPAAGFATDSAAYPVTDPAADFATDPAAYPVTDPAAGFVTDPAAGSADFSPFTPSTPATPANDPLAGPAGGWADSSPVGAAGAAEPATDDDRPKGWDPIRVSAAWPAIGSEDPRGTRASDGTAPVDASTRDVPPWEAASAAASAADGASRPAIRQSAWSRRVDAFGEPTGVARPGSRARTLMVAVVLIFVVAVLLAIFA